MQGQKKFKVVSLSENPRVPVVLSPKTMAPMSSSVTSNNNAPKVKWSSSGMAESSSRGYFASSSSASPLPTPYTFQPLESTMSQEDNDDEQFEVQYREVEDTNSEQRGKSLSRKATLAARIGRDLTIDTRARESWSESKSNLCLEDELFLLQRRELAIREQFEARFRFAHIEEDKRDERRTDSSFPSVHQLLLLPHQMLTLCDRMCSNARWQLALEVCSRAELIVRGSRATAWRHHNDEDWLIFAQDVTRPGILGNLSEGSKLMPTEAVVEQARQLLHVKALQRLAFIFHATGSYLDGKRVLEQCIEHLPAVRTEMVWGDILLSFPFLDTTVPSISQLLINLLATSTKATAAGLLGRTVSLSLSLRIAPFLAFACLKRLVYLKSDAKIRSVMAGDSATAEGRQLYQEERRSVAGQMLAARLYLVDALVEMIHTAVMAPPAKFGDVDDRNDLVRNAVDGEGVESLSPTRKQLLSSTTRNPHSPLSSLFFSPLLLTVESQNDFTDAGARTDAFEPLSTEVRQAFRLMSGESFSNVRAVAAADAVSVRTTALIASNRYYFVGPSSSADRDWSASRLTIVRWRYVGAQLSLLLASTQRLGVEELGQNYPLHQRTLAVISAWSNWLARSPLALTDHESMLSNAKSERWQAQVASARRYLSSMGMVVPAPSSGGAFADDDSTMSFQDRPSTIRFLSSRFPHSFGLALLATSLSVPVSKSETPKPQARSTETSSTTLMQRRDHSSDGAEVVSCEEIGKDEARNNIEGPDPHLGATRAYVTLPETQAIEVTYSFPVQKATPSTTAATLTLNAPVSSPAPSQSKVVRAVNPILPSSIAHTPSRTGRSESLRVPSANRPPQGTGGMLGSSNGAFVTEPNTHDRKISRGHAPSQVTPFSMVTARPQADSNGAAPQLAPPKAEIKTTYTAEGIKSGLNQIRELVSLSPPPIPPLISSHSGNEMMMDHRTPKRKETGNATDTNPTFLQSPVATQKGPAITTPTGNLHRNAELHVPGVQRESLPNRKVGLRAQKEQGLGDTSGEWH